MAPTDRKMKNRTFTAKEGNWKKSKSNAQGVKKKRKWVPEHKVFKGNVKEGQGFAFHRKEKVRHEYNKLLRKEKKNTPESKVLYRDEYPEHLRHLYMAEAEKLRSEARTNRMNRSKLRMRGQERGEERGERSDAAGPEVADGSELTESVAEGNEPAAAAAASEEEEEESLPMSNRMRKKLLKKTSYQRTKEEFEAVREKRRKKKEEYVKNKQQREEAIQSYKQRKREAFQMLSKKTKKGQPNLNLQMEYLLHKIQGTGK